MPSLMGESPPLTRLPAKPNRGTREKNPIFNLQTSEKYASPQGTVAITLTPSMPVCVWGEVEGEGES